MNLRWVFAILLLWCLSMTAPAAAGNPTHREGVISHMGPGFPDDYLAIPLRTVGSDDLPATDTLP